MILQKIIIFDSKFSYGILGLYDFQNISVKIEDISSSTDVILLVMTRWTSFDRRAFYRKSLQNSRHTKHTFKLLFLFNWTNSTSQSELENLREESEKYHDLILPKVEDSYKTQVFLLMSTFNWFDQLQHLKWIVKLNDDIIVNMTMLDHLHKSHKKDAISCYNVRGAPVVRDPDAKW